ncbi:MAG: glycosyltransferase family 4 protein [Bacteroidetes bacterium]|nr:glycosyltransferase family 4 protein [Bacteroidota bacterium]
MKKVLVITYYWPPSGGSGVQRWLKFVKYFREFGIEPIILTVDPEFASFPVLDESLISDIPKGIEIHSTKAKSPFKIYSKIRQRKVPQSGFAGDSKPNLIERCMRFIRGNFFIPDARIGWNKFAIKKAEELISKHQLDCVITTSPPHSSQLIGLELKNKFHLRWIADLRDPWTDIYYNKELYRTKWAENLDRRLEEKCLKSADKVIVVSESIAELFTNRYQRISSKISIIPNGYDEADFQNKEPIESDYNYISYIGNLGSSYPINSFLSEFKQFSDKNPNWRLRFVGNVFEKVKKQILNSDFSQRVEFISYVEHKKAIDYMLESKALLLIIPNSEENKGILTGKLFEYLAAKRPIIFIGPEDGDAAKILNNSTMVLINNKNITHSLQDFFQNINQDVNMSEIEKYSRKNLTKEIVSLIIN